MDQVGRIRKKPIPPVPQYSNVQPSVDTSPPVFYYIQRLMSELYRGRRLQRMLRENERLVYSIYMSESRVDNKWTRLPKTVNLSFDIRAKSIKYISQQNSKIYNRLKAAKPRIPTTDNLNKDWERNRREIIKKAHFEFVLFPPVPVEHVEDPVFVAPNGVNRPRVCLTVKVRGGATLGTLRGELFTDICPNTCELFTELLDGKTGFGYVGTTFFRKIPGLFWSGGDVALDSGAGCYAQLGHSVPIGAENCHFSHSMPGLLSMRVTSDDEVCGAFSVTFKPLPQLDRNHIVFGRIFRPCETYDKIKEMRDSPPRQVVEIIAAKRQVRGRWRHGVRNTMLPLPIEQYRKMIRDME